MPRIFWIVPAFGIGAILYALLMARNVLGQATGTPQMRQVGDMIFEGARAFLRRQYGTIAAISVLVAVIMGALLGGLGSSATNPDESVQFRLRVNQMGSC